MSDTRNVHIQVRYLAFSLCLFNGTAVLLSAGSCLTTAFETFRPSDNWQVFLLASLVGSGAMGAFFLASHVLSLDAIRLLSKPLITVVSATGGALFAASLATVSTLSETAVSILVATAGVVMSLGCLLQVFSWRYTFSFLSLRNVVTHVGLSVIIATTIALVIVNLSLPLPTAIAITVSPTIAALLAPISPLSPQSPNGTRENTGLSGKNLTSKTLPARNALHAFWSALAGATLCIGVLLSMWRSSPEDVEALLISSIAQGTFFGFIFCTLVLVIFALTCPSDKRLQEMSSWLCPAFAAMSLFFCIFTADPEGTEGFVMGSCTGAGFAFFTTIPLSLLYEKSGTDIKNDQFLWGTSVIILAAGGMVGAILAVAGDSGQDPVIFIVFFVIYLAAVALMNTNAMATTSSQSVDSVEAHCAQIAERCNLTSREAEILSYLAHGRSATYVAKELYISTETVKAHVKHIYEKLGVHSRNDLLNLVQHK